MSEINPITLNKVAEALKNIKESSSPFVWTETGKVKISFFRTISKKTGHTVIKYNQKKRKDVFSIVKQCKKLVRQKKFNRSNQRSTLHQMFDNTGPQ